MNSYELVVGLARGTYEKAWGAICLTDPGGLLDMWRDSYVPQAWTGYHSTVRGQEDLLRMLRGR